MVEELSFLPMDRHVVNLVLGHCLVERVVFVARMHHVQIFEALFLISFLSCSFLLLLRQVESALFGAAKFLTYSWSCCFLCGSGGGVGWSCCFLYGSCSWSGIDRLGCNCLLSCDILSCCWLSGNNLMWLVEYRCGFTLSFLLALNKDNYRLNFGYYCSWNWLSFRLVRNSI